MYTHRCQSRWGVVLCMNVVRYKVTYLNMLGPRDLYVWITEMYLITATINAICMQNSKIHVAMNIIIVGLDSN